LKWLPIQNKILYRPHLYMEYLECQGRNPAYWQTRHPQWTTTPSDYTWFVAPPPLDESEARRQKK